MAEANANTIRAMPGPASRPGMGTNTNAPARRASTRTKVSGSASGKERLACILREVPKDAGGIVRRPVQHPRQQQQKSGETRRKPRNGAEYRVLQRERNLHQVN